MNDSAPNKLEGTPAAEWAARLKLDQAVRALAAPDATVAAFTAQLLTEGHAPAAMAILANALPKREAVWWAGLAARHTQPYFAADNPQAAMAAALAAAERWVRESSETARRATEPAAEKAGLSNPCGLTAFAAFWSGGSVAPHTAPAVQPPEHVTANLVLGAVVLAAVAPGAVPKEARFQAFAEMAFDIAKGGDGTKVTFNRMPSTAKAQAAG